MLGAGGVRDVLLRGDLQSFHGGMIEKYYYRTIKEYKIKCKCCVTKMMTVKNIFCDSWWFELLS